LILALRTIVVLIIAVICQQASAVPSQASADRIDFNRDVRPILADTCFECHGPDAAARKGKLRLDTKADVLKDRDGYAIVVPGKPDDSELVLRIFSDDRQERMPPAKAHRQLTPKQAQTLKRWIAQGADWDEHWAFNAPVQASLPEVKNTNWPTNPIDRFVLAKLEAEHIEPQPPAQPQVLLRRLSLDLTGLPPTVPQLDQFAIDYQRDARQAVNSAIDRLLADDQYGRHMAWTWMDAARYADTNGYQGDAPRVMWRWRDWMIHALNENLPYDRMTEQMLAGDLMEPVQAYKWETGDLLRDKQMSHLLTATGFLRNHRFDSGSGTIPEESKFENAADRMETTATVFMGLTMQCARCHDHKFDPIKNSEYYQLLAFFDKTPEYGSAMRGASHPYVYAPSDKQRQTLKEHDQRVSTAKKALADAEKKIQKEQADWETQIGKSPFVEKHRVTTGLKFQYLDPMNPKLVKKPIQPFKTRNGVKDLPAGALAFVHQRPKVDSARRGKAIRFNGKTLLRGPNDPGKITAGAKRWTLTLSFRADNVADQSLLSIVEKPDTNRNGIQVDLANSKLRLRHVCRWNHSVIEFVSTEAIEPSRWYHLAFTSDSRMQGIGYRAYLNGRPQLMRITKVTTNDSAGGGANAPLVVGGGPFYPGFQGALSDVRFYDRNLSADEVAMLADARSITVISQIPAAKRNALEHKTLRQYFLEHEAPPETAGLRTAVLRAEDNRRQFIKTLPTTMVMQDVTWRAQTRVRNKGIYNKLGDAVNPATPAVLPPLGANGKPNRLDLARWLVSGKHPLTTRVAVNRIWQQLFGRGLVDSPENFGTQCAKPLHAELLDWLAVEYVRRNWDTKALIKLIVQSSTYQQSSKAPADLWSRDPKNRLLGRGARYRLSFAVIRDQALHISGLLDTDYQGPPIKLEEFNRQKLSKTTEPRDEPAPRCRTIYTYWKRNAAASMLASFDPADRNICTVTVRRTNTPLQALITLNEKGLFEAAGAFAQRIDNQGVKTTDERLIYAFRSVTGQRPTPQETVVLKQALAKYRAQFTKNPEAADEVMKVAGMTPSRSVPELAAWTALANMLLNMDRTLTRE